MNGKITCIPCHKFTIPIFCIDKEYGKYAQESTDDIPPNGQCLFLAFPWPLIM